MSHSPANASFVRCAQEASTKRLWQYATALPDGSEALRVEVCRRNNEVLEIVNALPWAMPLVASVGIAVGAFLTMHGWRKEDQRREVERAEADARRDALLERNTAELHSLRGEIKAVEGRLGSRMDGLESGMDSLESGLEGRMDSLETRLEGRMDSLETRLEGRMDALENRLEGRMDALETRLEGRMDGLEGRMDGLEGRIEEVRKDLEGRINAHEDKCEARWLQQAKEFGEMRGALAALQRTVEAGGAKGRVADPPQDVGQR